MSIVECANINTIVPPSFPSIPHCSVDELFFYASCCFAHTIYDIVVRRRRRWRNVVAGGARCQHRRARVVHSSVMPHVCVCVFEADAVFPCQMCGAARKIVHGLVDSAYCFLTQNQHTHTRRCRRSCCVVVIVSQSVCVVMKSCRLTGAGRMSARASRALARDCMKMCKRRRLFARARAHRCCCSPVYPSTSVCWVLLSRACVFYGCR